MEVVLHDSREAILCLLSPAFRPHGDTKIIFLCVVQGAMLGTTPARQPHAHPPPTTNPSAITSKGQNEDGTPKGIRIPVTAVKGRCPRPLDDGGTPLSISMLNIKEINQNNRIPVPLLSTKRQTPYVAVLKGDYASKHRMRAGCSP